MHTIVGYVIKMLILAPLGILAWGLFRPWRLRRMAWQGLQSGPYRESVLLLLSIFLAGLLGHTKTPVAKRNGNYHYEPYRPDINLIQYDESRSLFCYYAAHGMWRAILINFPGNIIMFIPIGLFAGLLADKPAWYKSTLFAFFLSLFIEVFQLFVSRGTDIDDLILNTIGGLIGHWSFMLLRRVAPRLVRKCTKYRKGSV